MKKKKKEKIIFRIKLILLQFRKYDKITTDRFIHNFLIKIHILFLRAMKNRKKKKKKTFKLHSIHIRGYYIPFIIKKFHSDSNTSAT